MRKLGNTLYVTTPGVYLSLDGENIVLRKDDEELARRPLHNLEGIVAFGYSGASPALMGACARAGIGISFLSMHGRFLARVSGPQQGNILLRREQYRLSGDAAASARIARRFVQGKIYNARWVLERAVRDHGLRLDTGRMKDVSSLLEQALQSAEACTDLETLRGVEGEAAMAYFSVLDQLILQQKEDFVFAGRSRRPPLDNVNAMLSFIYTLLAHDTASALETVGLDPYAGFLHRDRPGRVSLALDVMEELRAVFADRLVLSLINKRMVEPSGFTIREDGAVVMEEGTRKTILKQYQLRKMEEITHPFLGEKLEWGLVPYAQALLLARYLRGDLDDYPPFFWK